MTTKTEQSRRELFRFVEHVKAAMRAGEMPLASFPAMESALESHLEDLRQELKTSHEATGELAIQLSEIKTERDELRNKLQAFEFANKNAGEMLRDALATVKRQREYIRTLYTSRKARKVAGSTSGQNKIENVPKVKCGASDNESEECSRCKGTGFEVEFQSGALRAPCFKCETLVGVLTR